MNKDSSVFLLKPYDHILVRQNPIYKETAFVFERLNKDLSIDKEEITSYHIPDANSAEEFLLKAIDHPRMKSKARTSRKYAMRPGWVRVIAPRDTSIEELWKIGMQKLGRKELYTIND